MKKSILLILLIATFHFLKAQDLKERLYELPDVIFKQIKTPISYEKAYELKIKQALDHENPESGYFYQKVYLSHLDFDSPMVLVTNGYNKDRNSITEVARLLKANQLSVEHRYFGESIPDSLNYKYLTLEQACADLHHITELFKSIYSSNWISTGISKGGQTTLIYRYLYPDDVQLSIPYVAPINLNLEDRRIYTFLDTVGTDSCRNKIKFIQKRILQERDSVIPRLRWYSYGAQLHFNYLKFEEAFEYQVLEYPFSFWQWGASCDEIPNPNGPIDSILYHFVQVSGLDFFADASMEDFASHYYQAGSQMGYYAYEIDEIKPYLKAIDTTVNPSAVFMPNKMEVKFNNDLILKAKDWLEKEGNNIIYINGNKDTWSATAIRPQKERDALWFFLKDQDHGGARIKNFSEEEKEQLMNYLEKKLGLNITN